ncbi:MAG: hypothetical protein LBU32_24065 [Clostridiales bacterium]|nr:hypothetical protein [Clostridiales bacterium]
MADRKLAALDVSGNLTVYSVDAENLAALTSVNLYSEASSDTASLGNPLPLDAADAVLFCGSNVAAQRSRTVALYDCASGSVYKPSRFAMGDNGSMAIPASLGYGVMTYQGATAFETLLPPGCPNPVSFLESDSRVGGSILAGKQDGNMLAIVHIDGFVELLHLEFSPLQVSESENAGILPIPFGDSAFMLAPNGDVYDGEGVKVAAINHEFDMQEPIAGERIALIDDSEKIVVLAAEGGAPVVAGVFSIAKPPGSGKLYLGSSAGGGKIVAFSDKGYAVADLDGAQTSLELRQFDAIGGDDEIIFAAVNSDGSSVALKTLRSVLYLVDQTTGDIISKTDAAMPQDRSGIAFNPNGELAVLSINNRLLLLDESLTAVESAMLAYDATTLFSYCSGRLLGITHVNGDISAFDSSSLNETQTFEMPKGYVMAASVADGAGKALWHASIYAAESGYKTRLFRYSILLDISETSQQSAGISQIDAQGKPAETEKTISEAIRSDDEGSE